MDVVTPVLCKREGCTSRNRAYGLCRKHLNEDRKEKGRAFTTRAGSPYSLEECSYGALHLRLSVAKGSAKDYPCAICGTDEGRREWAYNNVESANERTVPDGPYWGIKYSLDPDDYFPACIPCHRGFDRGFRNG